MNFLQNALTSTLTPTLTLTSAPTLRYKDKVLHLPYFIIAGTQKGGTTFLRWLLVQHPNLESGDGLHGETRGEPHFFDWGYKGLEPDYRARGRRRASAASAAGPGVKVGAAVQEAHGVEGHAERVAAVAEKYSKSFHLEREVFESRNRSTLFFDTTPAYLVEVIKFYHLPNVIHGLSLICSQLIVQT